MTKRLLLAGFLIVLTGLTCAAQPFFVNGQNNIFDPTYTPFGGLVPTTNYFAIGAATRQIVASANYFIGDDVNFPLSVSGTGKYYIGRMTSLDVNGTTTNPTIIGNWTSISSNGLFPTTSGTGTIYGSYANADVGAPVNEAFGGYFAAQSGGSGASGLKNIIGVRGAVGMAHNGSTTNAFAGDFWLTGSNSPIASFVTTAAAVRARASIRPGITVTDLHFVSLTGTDVQAGGSATNTSGIYADTSIDIGTAKSYFLNSLSQSPSRMYGNLAILTNAGKRKGLILQAPDNGCWRITVDNVGGLQSASIPCP